MKGKTYGINFLIQNSVQLYIISCKLLCTTKNFISYVLPFILIFKII
jgi:hypothetical protein